MFNHDFHFSWSAVVISILIVVLMAILVDIRRRKCSESHSLMTMLSHYVIIKVMALLGSMRRRKLEKVTQACGRVQEELLMEILKTNGRTKYGMKYKLFEVKNKFDFVAKHPLSRYNHYQEYIDRVAKGEQNVLTSDKPLQLGVTSGTSGSSNLLVFTRSASAAFFMKGIVSVFEAMFRSFPKTSSLQRTVKFFYTPRWRKSEGGLKVGPNSSSPSNSKSILHLYTTPKVGYDILTEPELQYIHLLFGLKDRNVGILESNFAPLIYAALVSLERNWPELVNDIELGRVNPELAISDTVRHELNKFLTPDKVRAEELKREFGQGFDNIVGRIWPNMNLILTVTSGSADLYAKKLQSKYIRSIPMYSPLYGATEGLLGVNLWPKEEKALYLMVPDAQFFEFIPIENSDEDQPKTVFAEDVEEGCTYELVVTTRNALYRYRIGDVVKVARFHNGTPVLEFLYRQGQLLNVHMEKTNETDFYEAVVNTLKNPQWCDLELIDYTCAESVLLDDVEPRWYSKEEGLHRTAPFYAVFAEFNNEQLDSKNKAKVFAEQLDATLCQVSPVYRSFRVKGSIDQLQLYAMKNGTFARLRTFLLQLNPAARNQLKIPRVVKSQNTLKFLLENVL